MVIYRPHRGGLAEAMLEAKEFESFEDMKRYIYENAATNNGKKAFEIKDIVIGDDKSDDPRTGWKDTREVCIKRFFNANYIKLYGKPQCIGYCATEHQGFAGTVKQMCMCLMEE